MSAAIRAYCARARGGGELGMGVFAKADRIINDMKISKAAPAEIDRFIREAVQCVRERLTKKIPVREIVPRKH